MNSVARRYSVLALVVVGAVGVWLFSSCGVPAPPASLTDNSPVTDYVRYGQSLRFATDSPGVITLVRNVASGVSTLRVRSETRLPKTKESAYTRGRIIEKFETSGAASRYGAPIGDAYLWVKKNASGGFDATLFYLTASGDTGRIPVRHSHKDLPKPPKRFLSHDADCILDESTPDPDDLCCLCGMNYNCNEPTNPGVLRIDTMLNNANRPRRN